MKVLIVSPHFPPTNAADMHRVRLVLPYLADCDCKAEVLAVAPEQVAAPSEEWLVEGLPSKVPVHRVRAMGLAWRKVPGFGSVSFRALRAMRRAGDALLAKAKFDLVYFSTTQFPIHALGARWNQLFKIPFVMDYQDPWVNDYYNEHPEVTPPGGRLKYALVERLNRWTEPRVLRCCSGITSVSPEYPRQLRKRYPFLPPDWPVAVLPFPGDDQDLERVRKTSTRQPIFDPSDGLRHWVYTGRGGEDMHVALRGLFGALREHVRQEPNFLKNLRLHFIGTSYASAGKTRKTVEPVAQQFGLEQIVSEYPDRIPYSQSLRSLLDADALIVPGSDDPAYTASKIYPYLLARKPLLAIFHEQSSVATLMKKVGGGVCITFNDTKEQSLVERVHRDWLQASAWKTTIPLDESAFEIYTARAGAARLVDLFLHVLQ